MHGSFLMLNDDAVLTAQQSAGMDLWLPVENDEILSTNGVMETRRAWLPVAEKGFLRLKATGR